MLRALNKIFWFLLDIIEVVFLAFALYIILNAFVFQLHRVEGDSMLPNLHNNEYLITNKISKKINGFKRGDIVIFRYPKNPQREFVKRLIGLPGESLMLNNSKIIIYNKKHPQGFILNEGYLPKDAVTEPKSFLKEKTKINIPKDSYFVLGDNRDVSSDSRQWGLVPKKYMVGKAWIKIWPVAEISIIKRPNY